jgi:outer membrane biosynthesis protein TonB
MTDHGEELDRRPFGGRTGAGARTGPSARAVVGSVLLHVAIIAAAFGIGRLEARATEPEFKTFRVKIVSPPPQVAGEPTVVAAPAKPIVVEKPKEVAPAKSETKKPTAKTGETATPTKAKPKEPEKQVAGRNPKPGPVGGSGLNVDMDGEAFPFPGYLDNIIAQLHRYFRWEKEGNLSAVIGFEVMRDGRATRIKPIRGSGNWEFDALAVQAIERASQARAFNPLPAGYKFDRLPVQYEFLPPGKELVPQR